MKHRFLIPAAFIIGVALTGAGCTSPTPSSPTAKTPPPASKGALAFGKLPSISASATGASNGQSATVMQGTSAFVAPSVPAPAALTAGANAEKGIAMPTIAVAPGKPGSAIARPIPYPQPRPVTVEYILDAGMPTWGADGDVLQVSKSLPDTSAVRSLAGQSGLPSQVTDAVRSLSSVSIQWIDTDGFQWTFDAGSRATSFWKNQTAQDANAQQAPTLNQDAVLKAADAFLDAHGFSAIRARGGTIQDLPQILPMMKGATGASMPCRGGVTIQGSNGTTMQATPPSAPVPTSAGVKTSVATKTVSAPDAIATPTIYPNPCGWWPQQVSVVYPNMKDGKAVSDPYGNDSVAATITVSMSNNQVTNGNVLLDESTVRSAYPLIDQDTAKRRLESGGRNPVYPWGSEGGNITVHLKTIEVVWMRYDSWANNANETYYLPALIAKGTLDRGKGSSPEDYQTIIPLLKDDVFEDVQPTPPPYPVPMMQTGSAGGGVSGSARTITAPATPSVAPTGKE
jgi:hypothetical protein